MLERGGVAPMFLSSELDRSKLSASHPCVYPSKRGPGTQWVWDWFGPWAELNAYGEVKNFVPLPGIVWNTLMWHLKFYWTCRLIASSWWHWNYWHNNYSCLKMYRNNHLEAFTRRLPFKPNCSAISSVSQKLELVLPG